MIEKTKRVMDNAIHFLGLLTSLSKAFECQTVDLIIGNLDIFNHLNTEVFVKLM